MASNLSFLSSSYPSRTLKASQTPTSHITRPVQLRSRRIAMQYYEYIAGDKWAALPGIHIKQRQDATIRGDRCRLGDSGALTNRGTWKVVGHVPHTDEPIGEVNPGSGILTLGQFQCMCIIVAIFENEGDTTWSKAWLTHVSSQYADEVNGMIAKLNANNHGKAYVAIGGKHGSLGNMNDQGRLLRYRSSTSSRAESGGRRQRWREATCACPSKNPVPTACLQTGNSFNLCWWHG